MKQADQLSSSLNLAPVFRFFVVVYSNCHHNKKRRRSATADDRPEATVATLRLKPVLGCFCVSTKQPRQMSNDQDAQIVTGQVTQVERSISEPLLREFF